MKNIIFILLIIATCINDNSSLTRAPTRSSSAPTITSISPTVTSISPTSAPTLTRNPTFNPTLPSKSPTFNPTFPSKLPTSAPSISPTISPSSAPTRTRNPTSTPTFTTSSPIPAPTQAPSITPSLLPTNTPSLYPSISPTQPPTTAPTQAPSISPSTSPTTPPTNNPTRTRNPTNSPTQPTKTPSNSPTQPPTNAPSLSPICTDTIPPIIICPAPTFVEAFEEEYPPEVAGCKDINNNDCGCDNFVFTKIRRNRTGQEGDWSETETWDPLDCDNEIYYKDNRHWTCTDRCGNQAQCTQEIIVRDTTYPIIDCPAGITFEWPVEDEELSTTNLGNANCTDATPDVTHLDINTPQCGGTFDLTRKWTCADACGKCDICNQEIKVIDTTKPKMFTIAGSNPKLCCADSNACAEDDDALETTIPYEEYNSSLVHGATPICWDILHGEIEYDDPDLITKTWIDNRQPGCADNSAEDDDHVDTIIYRTWTCTDLCGNQAIDTCRQTIKLTDKTAPILNCPSPETIPYNDFIPEANCTDKIDDDPHIGSDETVITNEPCFKVTMRNYTCTDCAENEADSCSYIITQICPTPHPTLAPSLAPSISPTQPPSLAPSNSPTQPPSISPTQ
eukprot:116844_1